MTADLYYPRLLALSHATNPSLILFSGGNWSDADVIERMKHILGSLGADDINQSIVVVDSTSIRRRRLPI